ncbi:heme exporter protein C [Parapedobacter composti]|uniref:Heme exporter protein C n=1 Tax=Parapedobacter composti TaxID=623281 RepID=A0A1I1E3V6_9SPHI|nr:cytochrome c biogenesis protein [Parapedobacter composti]SFB81794.1 heme exporter protein C [Parapedobacter composti]
MKSYWWKILGLLLLLYSIIMGLLGPVPALPIVHETIRNVYFHVPMWFTMFTLYVISVVCSVKYLSSGNPKDDIIAVESVNVGIIFCAFGLISGMLWANFTWGDPWPNDPQLNGSAIATLMYLAYLVLRNALEEEQKRARISAIYNIFAFPIMIVLMYILPKTTDSLHPGAGGNSGFGEFDLDGMMKVVLYPASLGWILVGIWIMTLRFRIRKLEYQNDTAAS